MRDQILLGYINDFANEQNLDGATDGDLFEHFCNFCIASRHHPEPFNLDDIRVGGTGDLGLDGIAILVNDHIVTSIEEVDYFRDELRRLDVEFLFTQAKRSTRVEIGKLLTFLTGIRLFFDIPLPSDASYHIRAAWDLKKYIYDQSIHMEEAPHLRVFYCYGGEWRNDPTLIGRADRELEMLKASNMFAHVNFEVVDAKNLWVARSRGDRTVSLGPPYA